jgi:glutathione S-transferase
MSITLDPMAHKVTMVCTLFLFLKFFVTCLIQGGKRFAGGSRPPEDAKLSLAKKYKAKQTYGLEKGDNPKHAEADIRWQRIVHNDLENILMGIILAWGALLSPYSTLVHSVAFVVFAASRTLHTYTYAYEMQPGRAIWWGVAALSAMVIGVNGAIGVMAM